MPEATAPPVGYRPAHPMPQQPTPPAAGGARSVAHRPRGDPGTRSDSGPGHQDSRDTDDSVSAPPRKTVKKSQSKGAAKARRTDRVAAFTSRLRRRSESSDSPTPTREALERDDFDVPPVGGKPSVGKSRQAWMRLGIPVATLVAVGGLMYSCGVHTGSSRIPAAGAISQEEALKFRLSSYPTEQAASFAERYLEVCLTHPPATDTAGARARLDLLAQMATNGTAASCGYSGTAAADASEPRSIAFTGEMRSLKGYEHGAAAFLTFQVSWSDDKLVNAVVPVWVDDRANPTAMRVVGDLGFMPVSKLGSPPPYSETRTKDSNLAQRLQQSVLQPFVQAWGSSDTQQLGLVLTDDASFTAREGLRGVLSDPTVTSAVVFTGRTTEGAQIQYADEDEVIAQTSVQWFADTSAKQSAVYQIRLRLVQGKWSVVDIAGSAIDPTGGPAQSTTSTSPRPSSTSTTPSTTPLHDPSAPTLPPAEPN